MMKLCKLLIPLIALTMIGCGEEVPPEPDPEPEEETETMDDIYEEEKAKGFHELDKLDVDSFDRTYTKLESDTAYVRKVNNLTDGNYIMGVDASSVIVEEDSGVIYRDYNGNPQDVFKTLSESGVNYIRVRVWNDPYDASHHGYGGGNNDLAKAIEIGKRATQYNMSLLVDFHYSDFWADPSKQMAPKAWKDMYLSEKITALHDFTYNSLQTLIDNGVRVGMVQVGNETNSGNIAGSKGFQNFVKLAGAGSKAIREINEANNTNILVAVHFANPDKYESYLDWAERISTLDYDVFGTSFYPYWHGTLDNLGKVLSVIANRYSKYTMVMETSYAYSVVDSDFSGGNQIGVNAEGKTSGYDKKDYPFTVHGQINNFVDVLDTIVNHTLNGIGVCYWEGTWISVDPNGSWDTNSKIWEKYGSGWASKYAADYDPDDAGKNYGGNAVENQALFDPNGNPLESLKMFNLVRFGNKIENTVDGVQDIEIVKYETDTFSLPNTVPAVYLDNSASEIPVTWEPFDIEAHKALGNGRYDIKGETSAGIVWCRLSILEKNYLENYSFETGNAKYWKMTSQYEQTAVHKIKVTNENPQTGKYAYHFWTADETGVNFELVQEVKGLAAATYKLQASFLGGGDGSSGLTKDQNVYMYVMQNNQIIYQASHLLTKWEDGYNDELIKDMQLSGDVTIGFHVEVPQLGCWGDIDDVMLNIQK